jgi:ATP-dependent helicase/DNAse subunit B
MIITYFRSSSYNAHDGCAMNYFAEYVLGWRGPSNMKADMGTIAHKVLEILASLKKAQQDGKNSITDDIAGEVDNVLAVDLLVDKVFDGYVKYMSHHTWTEKERKICHESVWKALTHNNGMFDPRNRTIVASELSFDFDIKEPWAKYLFKTSNGDLAGYLSLKGTIDLVCKIEDGVYEIVDWKTGRRLNWNTGEVKTYEKLQDDPQLRIYHYAVSKLFPEVDQVMVTIFYINDGGPFTICYNKNDLPKTEQLLRKKFDKIRLTKTPKLTKSWKCSKLCHQGKTTFEGTGITPMQEFRTGQVCNKGSVMTKCEQLNFEIAKKGMDKVIEKYTHPTHAVGNYTAPGSVE